MEMGGTINSPSIFMKISQNRLKCEIKYTLQKMSFIGGFLRVPSVLPYLPYLHASFRASIIGEYGRNESIRRNHPIRWWFGIRNVNCHQSKVHVYFIVRWFLIMLFCIPKTTSRTKVGPRMKLRVLLSDNAQSLQLKYSSPIWSSSRFWLVNWDRSLCI